MTRRSPAPAPEEMSLLVRALARLLFLPSIVVGVAMLVKGYAASGGGFSGGLVAGSAVAMVLLAFGPQRARRILAPRVAPFLAAGGLLVMLAVVLVPLALGEPPLRHAPPPGAEVTHLGALELHTSLAFDLGIFLVVLGGVSVVLDVASGLRGWEP